MILLTDKKNYFIEEKSLVNLIEFKRNIGRDKLCKFEDYLVKKFTFCCWKIYDKEKVDLYNLEFLENVKKDYNLIPFLTLPFFYDDKTSRFNLLKDIWNLFYSDSYLQRTCSDLGELSLPDGCLYPKYVFIGEAPSKSRLPPEQNVYYNTLTRIYTQGKNCLLFRILSHIVFGNENWYTNIFKFPVFPEEKINDVRLDFSLELLEKEINLLNPEVIICLGNFVYEKIVYSDMFKNYQIKKIYHPSYVMRQGNDSSLYEDNMNSVLNSIEK